MSTRSRIAIKNNDGTIKSIYCHFDGYLSGVGEMLLENYKDENKIKDLIALGDISSLKENVNPPDGVKHTFDNPCDDVVVAYHRDRGEDFHDGTDNDEDGLMNRFNNSDEEFLYLFKDGKWFVAYNYGDDKHKFFELTKEFIDKVED
mgnify:CR=1 FL=1